MNNFDQFEKDGQEQPINWRELFERYLAYWKWIVISVFLFLVFGYLYNRTKSYQYQLTSNILVVDQTRSGSMNELSMFKQLDLVGPSGTYMTMVNNENEVIKSSMLMRRVVDELELHVNYYQTIFLRKFDLYKDSPYYVKMDSMSLVNLQNGLDIDIVPENNYYIIKGTLAEQEFQFEVKQFPVILKTPAGSITISIRDGKEIPTYKVNITIHNPSAVARFYAGSVLSSEVSKLVDVITLRVKVQNIQKGREILNTLTYFYNQDAIDQVNRSADNTAKFIDLRLRLLATELTDVEQDVESYKMQNQMTEIGQDARIFLEQNTKYEQQHEQVETQLSLVRFIQEFISQPSNQTALIPNLGLTDGGLVSVINSYNDYLLVRERISSGSSEQNPAITKLNSQLDAARVAITTSLRNSRKGLEIQRDDLQTQYMNALTKIKDLPRQEREFIEIKRQQQVKESLYLFLLQKREEASLIMAVTVPKGRVLNAPESYIQVSPRSVLNMAIALFIGLLIPIMFLFIKDLVNTSVISRDQIERMSDVPVLSELGHNESDNVIIDHKSNVDSNSELFRLLRTKLQFALNYPTQKVIMITSTEPGEGKSYVSINLAISLSLIGKKVLLLGLDLRKPQLQRHLSLPNDAGMSAYLSGQVTDYSDLIQLIPDYQNLSVIAAGVIPPNPNELIMSDRLDSMIEQLKKTYEYIVIDTAPVGAVSDSFLIDRVSDIVLYIVRMDYSDKRNLEFLNHLKQDQTLKRPFIVINDMDTQSKYYYHRGYSYGYGKYYGQNKKK